MHAATATLPGSWRHSCVSTADGLSAAFAMDERHILRQLEEAGGSLVSPVTVGAAVLLIVCFVCLYCCGGSKPTSQRVYAVPHTVEAVIFSLDDGTQSWSKVMALLKEVCAARACIRNSRAVCCRACTDQSFFLHLFILNVGEACTQPLSRRA